MAQSGAQAFYEPIPRRFKFAYTTLKRLRDEGISVSALSDERAQQLIYEIGNLINRVTDQWFIPIESTERLSIRPNVGQYSAHLDQMVPILEVSSVVIDYSAELQPALTSTVPETDYRIDDRFLTLISSFPRNLGNYTYFRRTRFPDGPRNILVEGVYGWVENRPFSDLGARKIEAVTTAPLSTGDTIIHVDDSSKFSARDVIILRSGDPRQTFGCHAIVSEAPSDSPANVLIVDPIQITPGQSLPAGSNVVAYGQVPAQVEWATILLVNHYRSGLATSAFAQLDFNSRLLSETTDNYSYKLETQGFATSQGAAGLKTFSETGNRDADRILCRFLAPPYLGAV